MIPGAIYNIGSGILRAVGDSKRPLYYLIICSIVNVVFDFVFVVILHKGIAGAAIATFIAQTVCAILVTLQLIFSKDVYQLTLSKIKFHLPVLKKIVKLVLLLEFNQQCIVSLISSYKHTLILLEHKRLLHGQSM